MNRATLEQTLNEAGLSRVARAISAAAEEAITFRTTDGPVDADASRLGGQPRLPAGTAWPSREDRPLGFLGQIRLQDLPVVPGAALLPKDGWLSFFYDVRDQPWGFDPKDKGAAAVLYRPAGQAATEAPWPAGLDDATRFPARALAFSTKLTLPDGDSPALESLHLSSEELDGYYALTHEDEPEPGESHQILGHARPVQNAMELECQLVTNGLYCGDPMGYEDPRAAELRAGAHDWKLLLQLDTDDAAGMMWGDMGRLYFWMRSEDLSQRAFDRAWAILQCG